jgi:hypothetical protein
MSKRDRHRLAAALALLLAGGADALADPPPAALSLRSPSLPAHELTAAAGYWQRACGEPGGLPRITVGGPGVPVEVRRRGDSWSPNRRCGMTSVRRRDGEIVGYVVDVFVRQRNGAPCFPLVDEVAHELGHVLGLADDPSAEGAGTIMGVRARNVRRRVDAPTCDRVAALWTPREAVASLQPPTGDGDRAAPSRAAEWLPPRETALDWWVPSDLPGVTDPGGSR